MGAPIEETPSNDLKILLGEDENEIESTPEPEDDESEIPEPPEDIDEDEEESDSQEDDEEDESDSDDKKDDDDDDEKIGAEFSGRPTYRDLKEYDPKLFKKFPQLRDVFFREREYTKLYATVEDAQDAYNELTKLKAGEARISAADPDDFLEILNDYDPNKERQFIQNFLPALHKRNRTAFFAITEPVLKNALRSMHSDAKRNGNESLMNSALNAHEWLFGNDKIEEPARIQQQARTNEPDPEKEELKRQNQRILENRHNEFTSNVLDIASKKIRSRIERDIPEDTSAFLRNSITKEVMDELAKVLRADPAHRSNMDRLLRNASKNNYSVESKDSIVTAYLSRAIVGLPSILKKVKAEALKGAKPRVESRPRANGSDSRTPRRDATKINSDKAKDVKSGKISALDFLNS